MGTRTKRRAAKRRATAAAEAPAPGANLGVGDEAVRKATGKGWEEWFAILDRADASRMKHKEIAATLAEQHGVPGWWAQMVSVGYERGRCLRGVGQTPAGWQTSASRTLSVPIARLYEAWAKEPRRAEWLREPRMIVRTATKDTSMRITWPDGTYVDVTFKTKGGGRSTVAVQHRKLANADAVARAKAEWVARLDRLATLLSP